MNVQIESETNARRLLWAGFVAILAAGMGFGIRGGIFDNWGAEFGFTATQLGAIGGAGFSGFCFGIIIGGLVCDRIGYGKLVIVAFVLHVLSAVVTVSATGDAAYTTLYLGMFLFALANGTLEAVANPLVATLFPEKRTHYLNILHASWPAGLVLGGVIGWVLDDRMQVDWRVALILYLIPTLVYGAMFFRQHMPRSEAALSGLKLGEMLKDVGILGALVICYLIALFCQSALGLNTAVAYGIAGAALLAVAWMTNFALGSWLLFVLFVTHLLIGAVELGTDGWIQNITGNLLTSEQGKILFVITSATMFALRFCADFIERRLGLSPVALLLVCSVLACVGLNLTSAITGLGGALFALMVYAVGKTFFWPTMLAIASDRFPRTGAVAISIMGGIGMMSAGLVGTPGLGYAKDRFSGEALQTADPAVYEEYRAPERSRFLFFDEAYGLDGRKLGEIQTKLGDERRRLAAAGEADPQAALTVLGPEEQLVQAASVAGDRKTLKADAYVPALLAVIFLALLLYFRAIGGYRRVTIGAPARQVS